MCGKKAAIELYSNEKEFPSTHHQTHHEDRHIYALSPDPLPWQADKREFHPAVTKILTEVSPHYQVAKGFFLGGKKVKVVDKPFLELQDHRRGTRVIDELIHTTHEGMVKHRWLGRLLKVCRISSAEGTSDWAKVQVYGCDTLQTKSGCPIFKKRKRVISWIWLDEIVPSVQIRARVHVLPYPLTSLKQPNLDTVSLNTWLRRKHAAFDVSPTSSFFRK
jgi:hypothetical protein